MEAELLGVNKICGIDVIVQDRIGCQVPCRRSRFVDPIMSFFGFLFSPQLVPHNVLYDTSGRGGVKCLLQDFDAIVKGSYPQTLARENT